MQDALLSIPSLLDLLKQTLLPDGSMIQHVGARDRNAQHDVSNEQNVMTAVPANVVSSPSAVMNLPAEVDSSPAVAVLNVDEVVLDKHLVKWNGAAVELAGVKFPDILLELDNASSSDSSDSSSPESLIPVEWLQFRYCTCVTLKLIFVNLAIYFSFSLAITQSH